MIRRSAGGNLLQERERERNSTRYDLLNSEEESHNNPHSSTYHGG
jgi:hypothetical protein